MSEKHKRPSGIRLSSFHQKWIYSILLGLCGSGMVWLILHYFFTVQGVFGPEHSPLEVWCLKIHGAMTMFFLVILGTLMPIHIRGGWKLRRNYWSGLCLLFLLFIIIVTGYGLYYVASDTFRPWISVLHWITALFATLGFVIHVLLGKKVYSIKK